MARLQPFQKISPAPNDLPRRSTSPPLQPINFGIFPPLDHPLSRTCISFQIFFSVAISLTFLLVRLARLAPEVFRLDFDFTGAFAPSPRSSRSVLRLFARNAPMKSVSSVRVPAPTARAGLRRPSASAAGGRPPGRKCGRRVGSAAGAWRWRTCADASTRLSVSLPPPRRVDR